MPKDKRYMVSEEIPDNLKLIDTSLAVSPVGFCDWCGKPVKRKNQRFCSSTGYYPWGQRKISDCYLFFYNIWGVVPRFRKIVLVRDDFTCKLCGEKPTFTNEHGLVFPDLSLLHVDHIHPFSKGGETTFENLRTLCRSCNLKKKDKVEFVPQPALF